jgi:AcrR family transcriptional regulator
MSMTENAATTRRNAQSAATRAAIIDAAHRLMLERGYIPTSISAIAEQAGVAVQTIYNSVGNKADLLSAVLDRAAAGPDAPALVPAVTRGTRSRSSGCSPTGSWRPTRGPRPSSG